MTDTINSTETPGVERRANRGQQGNATPAPAPANQNLPGLFLDLTDEARNGHLVDAIGRNQEIEEMIGVLLRKTKANPVLLGDAGVGKTAIVEGFAWRIYARRVPASIVRCRILSVSMGALIAGTGARGAFEDRIQEMIRLAETDRSVILFIDEIHLIFSDSRSSGAGSASLSQLLKPALARGRMRVIGATTVEEYRSSIETDRALARRFTTIDIAEPNEEDCLQILTPTAARIAEHHALEHPHRETIAAAIRLSARYLHDRKLPDKAIDLLDETGARVRLELDANPARNRLRRIAVRDLEARITQRTGIPIDGARSGGSDLVDMEERLARRIQGQNDAIRSVADAIRRGRSGLRDTKRPVAVLFLVGPSGVGKTELAKALAEELFGDENALIRFDMAEFHDQYTAARLIGAPPGYIGYNEAGAGAQFTEKIRRKPFSVILLDEIEKAHATVHDTLLAVFEDGRLTDGRGATASFRESVIVMTSNSGSGELAHAFKSQGIGFGTSAPQAVNIEGIVHAALPRQFRPEFINRIDSVICFKPLAAEILVEIARSQLGDLAIRALSRGVELRITEEAVEHLASVGKDTAMGARPIRRAIQDLIEVPLAAALCSGSGGQIRVSCESDGDEMRIHIVRR